MEKQVEELVDVFIHGGFGFSLDALDNNGTDHLT